MSNIHLTAQARQDRRIIVALAVTLAATILMLGVAIKLQAEMCASSAEFKETLKQHSVVIIDHERKLAAGCQ